MYIIHVNRSHIAMNAKDGGNRPVYTIKDGKQTRYARGWSQKGGEVRGVYSQKALPCGARAWLEVVGGEITLVDEMSFKEARIAV